MPRFSANLSMLFGEHEFLDRFDAAARAGFKGVEYIGPYDHAPDVVAARLKKNGLSQVLFNLPAGDWAKGERGIAVLPNRVPEFRQGVAKAITYAHALGCEQINCLAGIAPQGVDRTVLENVLAENLAFAAERLEQAGIKLLIEPINTRDIPGFFLNHTDHARAICSCNTTSITCRSWRGISPVQSRLISAASRISSLRTIPAVTSRGRARSTIPSSTSTSTASAIPAGSAPNTSRKPAPRPDLAGSGNSPGREAPRLKRQ